jgi:hypothetical protein
MQINLALALLSIHVNFAAGMVIGAYWVHEHPCEYEDSEWCYWNASTMGNGQGQSFIRVFNHTLYFGDYSHAKD